RAQGNGTGLPHRRDADTAKGQARRLTGDGALRGQPMGGSAGPRPGGGGGGDGGREPGGEAGRLQGVGARDAGRDRQDGHGQQPRRPGDVVVDRRGDPGVLGRGGGGHGRGERGHRQD